MSPKDKTDRLIKTQQQPLSKLIMINKLQCSAFGLSCFVLDARAPPILFCFSRENRSTHPFFEDSLAISLPALAHLAR